MLKSARIALAAFLLVFFASGNSSFAQEDANCFLSASQSSIEVGDAISWRLSANQFGSGSQAYWGGTYGGSRYISERIPDYSGQSSWTKIYSYGDAKPGNHERFIEIKDNSGHTICKTNVVNIAVKPRERVKIGPVTLPIDAPKPKSANQADPVFGVPIAEKCEASFSYSCRPEKLKAVWNLGQGSGCTIYIRDGRGDHSIANNCAGSVEVDFLDGEEISGGGNYQFFASNGKEGGTCYNEMKGQVTVDCSQAAGGEVSAVPSETRARQVDCSLTPSARLIKVGEKIKWDIESSDYGASAEWGGTDNGRPAAPAPVGNYPPEPGKSWSAEYNYSQPSEYTRFVRIKDGSGNTICTTRPAAGVSVTQTGELTSITSLPGGSRTVTLVTINGQRMDANSPRIKVDFPKLFARGETQTVVILVKYSDGFTDTKTVTFRNKISGVEVSEEDEHSVGEACDIGSVHWLKAAKNKEGPEPLFCRDIEGRTGGSKWITQKQANDWCQGQRGLTALAGDGNGGTTTFYCNGQNWVDERTWLAFQEPQPAAPPSVIPAGSETGAGGGQQTGGGQPQAPSAPARQTPVKNPFDLCDASAGCFDTVKSPSGEDLYCRNIGSSTSEQYMWITGDYAGQQCSTTQVGRTALCGGKIYSCDGTTWREAQPAGGAGGGVPAKTVSRVYFQTSTGQVPVAQGQQVRIPISGGATITLVVEYSDGSSKSRALTFRPPAPQPVQQPAPEIPEQPSQPAQPQPEPEAPNPAPSQPEPQPVQLAPVQPAVEQPAAQACPGQCGDSESKGEGGTTCTGWLQGQYEPCKDNSRYPYCYTSCQ